MRKMATVAALAASLSSAGCVTTLGIVVSVANANDEDAGSDTVKRLLVGAAADALLFVAVGAAIGPIDFGGDH